MAEKRKAKKRKEEFNLEGDEKPEKPDPEEYKVAKWMKKNLPTKKTKFLNHNVEYFTGSKAVDQLMESHWAKPLKEGEDPLFLTRMDAIELLDKMLRHKFFHRAKKVPVSEQELKAKMKKKVKKDDDKSEDKKKKDDEAAESSHAEGKDVAQQEGGERDKKKKKIRLEMHMDQLFHDGLDAYVWLYDPIPLYYWLFGALVVLGAIAVCLFPLWPPTVRLGVYYLSVAAAGLLMLIMALAVLRVIVFCLLWLITLGRHHLWLFPNLTEDVGFFASFWPLYQYEYKGIEKKPSKKKKKDKESDNEEEEKTEKEDEDEEGDEEAGRSQSEDDPSVENSQGEDRGGGTEGGPGRDSETESEGSSQQSQTGKDFEIVDKEDVKDS